MRLAWKVLLALVVLYGVAMIVLRPAAGASSTVTLLPADSQPPLDPNRKGAQSLGPFTPVLSPPVREMATVEPNDYLLNREVNPLRHETVVDAKGNLFGTTTTKINDPLVANSQNRAVNTPGVTLSFAGIGATGVLPPDTVGDVGPNHYVQSVNSRYQIWNKSGTPLTGQINLGTLFASVPGNACANDNDGDPIVLYDQFADKWLISEFDTTSPYNVCVAISQTGDPTGSYWLYAFTTPRFPDYFKIGVWADGYYMGTNSGSQNQYDVFVMERPDMIVGAPATAQFFQSFSNLMMPADADGSTLPPANSPGYFYTLKDGGEPYFNNPASDRIEIYEFDVDWTTPANSTYTLAQSITDPTFAPFNWTVCGFFVSNCLPQPGTATLIDSASWWPMFRLQYRNFGDHESMVGNFTVDVNSVGNRAGIRWFELQKSNNAPGGPWTLYQQGTHSPDADHRFMGSIAMDGQGNIALAYSITSGTVFPSIRYATRLVTDTLGTLQTEATLMAGTGSQTHAAGRWGDYSTVSVDPTNDCTFWVTNEYIQTTGSAPWLTRIGTFTIPECLTAEYTLAAASRVLTVCDPGNAASTVTVGSRNGYSGNVTLSTLGLPAGASSSFTVNPVAAPGSSNMTISTSGTAAGSYGFTLRGVAGPITKNTAMTLTVNTAAPAATTLSAPADGAINTAVNPTFSWSAVAQATGYIIEIATDTGFTSIVRSATVPGTSYMVSPALNLDTVYYWRVRPTANACGAGTNSATFAFRTSGVACNLYTSTDVPKAISASGTPSVSSVLNVASGGTINDVNVVSLNGTHTWINDLDFNLTSPAATAVQIMARSCGNEDNFNLNLDDEAAGLPGGWPCPPTGGGTYRPSSPLSAFDGQSSTGTWTLRVDDNANQDGGSLNGWGLQICTSGGAVPAADYGDLSSGYGVAWHTGTGALRLGTNWTADSGFAIDSDDVTDDGVARTGGAWLAGNSVGLNVTVSGGDGNDYLACWFDWNDNGSLANPGEKTVAQVVNNGVNAINFTVPAGFNPATNPILDSRCRLYEAEPTLLGTETPAGGVTDGEVEDYRWEFEPTAVTLRDSWLANATSRVWLAGGLSAVILLSLAMVVARRSRLKEGNS